MANMFKPVKAQSVEEYLALVPPERKEAVAFLHDFIQRASPTLRPYFAQNMLGYGSFKYTNYKKEIIDWPIVALANQKNYISIYVCALDAGEYVAEKHKDKLGKVSVGKSCIRLKKVEDVDLAELKLVLESAAENPGLV